MVDNHARPYGAAPGTLIEPQERIMTRYPTIVRLPKHEPTGQGAGGLLLVLGVAAFGLGVTLVSLGVLLSLPVADLVPTTHTALGRGERQLPAREERPMATAPPAARVSPMPVMSTTSSGGTRGAAVCLPQLALACDLRLGLMEMALQQRGHFLGLHVVPFAPAIPTKYGVLPPAEASGSPAAASPPSAPPTNDPGC